MKKHVILLLGILGLSSCGQDDEIIGIDETIQDPSELISICCYDEFNDHWQTIQVNQEQLRRHLEHGDKRSPCNETTPPDELY